MSGRGETTKRIRDLNDEVRVRGPVSEPNARWMLTPGVLALGALAVADAIKGVQTFTAFSADNDPHREHDFGSLTIAGQRLFWKIDYYDLSLASGSADPSDETVTCRVLTVMLADEY